MLTPLPALWGADTALGTAGHVPVPGRALPMAQGQGRDESSRYPKDVSEPSVVCLAGEW